jgi:hypothetical protein
MNEKKKTLVSSLSSSKQYRTHSDYIIQRQCSGFLWFCKNPVSIKTASCHSAEMIAKGVKPFAKS